MQRLGVPNNTYGNASTSPAPSTAQGTVSQVLAHEAVAFVPYADGVWHIFYRFHFLGLFDEREGKIIPATHWHAKPSKP
jgi:CP4-6 prophage; predicted DNA-binding transcriptional regulator